MNAPRADFSALPEEAFAGPISAVIPARNEEGNIAAAVESLAGQEEIAELIVVNDQSTDRTAEVLARLARRVPKLVVVESGELPAGWTGKNHAAWLGARAASGEWLLFTDADTTHLPGAAARALADAASCGAALVSYSPEQITRGFWPSALIPFIYCQLARQFDFARVNDSRLPDAAANGQFLLLRRDAYEAIGGHRAVRDRVLEDVCLARRAKQAGYRLYFAPGRGIARTEMYRSFRAMWQGWTKNLYLLFGGSAGAMLRAAGVSAWLGIALLIASVFVREPAGWVLLVSGAALFLRSWVEYGRALRRNRYPARLILYYGAGLALFSAALLASAWKNTGGTVVWKGREYPAGTP